MKSLTLREIADSLNGNLIGDPDEQISGMNGILEAQPGDLTFLANPKYKEHLPLCKASAVLVGREVDVEGVNLIQVDNPRMAYGKVIVLMHPPKKEIPGISDRAVIAKDAVIGENCSIYPGVYIAENVVIGKNTVIYPNVYIGDKVTIGDEIGRAHV